MKIFTLNSREYDDFEYPEDMKQILSYLNKVGEIHVSNKTIEKLYRDYSDDIWCAGWMEIDSNILFEFANWLAEKDV